MSETMAGIILAVIVVALFVNRGVEYWHYSKKQS